MAKKQILLLDMYGVIIKESKGNFIPYTFEYFDIKEHSRLKKAFREEGLFTKAGNGELSSDEFLSLLGYPNPTDTMQDYLTHFFVYTIEHMQCKPQECIFVDNSVQNLNAAQNTGINTVLFNRDNETYSGNIVNNFQELDSFLNKRCCALHASLL